MAEITALYVVPDHRPMQIRFDNNLESYQTLLNGEIQAISLTDNVDVVCNDFSKFNGMIPNRMLRYNDFDGLDNSSDTEFDLIHGPFLVVGADNDLGEWKSLTREQIEYYSARFHAVEIYLGHELGVTR